MSRRSPELAGLWSGEPIPRRALLRAAAGTALGVAIPAAIPACGKVIPGPPNNAYDIVAASTAPPIGLLAALVAERARATNMNPNLYPWTVAQVKAEIGRSYSFDPVTNRYPPFHPLLVAAASAPALTAQALATAIAQGTKIVSYPVPVAHETAAIVADPLDAAEMLAAHAAAWARTRLGGQGEALLVLPPSPALYQAQVTSIDQTFRGTLARAAPGVTVRATILADADDFVPFMRGLTTYPDTRIVLVWDDATAIRVAAELSRHRGARQRASLYVGALALPSATSGATLAELARGDVLRAVVAARARHLANAMVDLPRALLGGKQARDIRLPLQLLTPRSAALETYRRDYAVAPLPPLLTTGYFELGSATY